MQADGLEPAAKDEGCKMSLQKGHVFSRKTKRHGLVHVIMYRAQQPDGTWKQVAETIHTRFKKAAEQELQNRLNDLNGGQAVDTSITFSRFVTEYWEPH